MSGFTALSLGSNQGDRLSHIDAMERALRSVLAGGGVQSSGVMETAPVGVDCIGQPPYLNKVITGRYPGDAYGLLAACLSIEAALGRTRPAPKAPRTADVDILLFGDEEIIDPPKLIIPHPELINRRFCLEGLTRIDPSIVVPVSGRLFAVGQLYKNMGDEVVAQDVSFL